MPVMESLNIPLFGVLGPVSTPETSLVLVRSGFPVSFLPIWQMFSRSQFARLSPSLPGCRLPRCEVHTFLELPPSVLDTRS